MPCLDYKISKEEIMNTIGESLWIIDEKDTFDDYYE